MYEKVNLHIIIKKRVLRKQKYIYFNSYTTQS